jgi:peptide/nickel transport system substrate-binding protein
MISLRSALRLLILPLVFFAFGLLAPAEAKNVLRWASQGDALSSDPHAVNETPTITANRQVYESLINRAPDQTKEPCLAVSWRLTQDPTIWEFKLREGVTFHEGQPFTADDVVFSFERALSPTSGYKDSLANVTAVKAIDPHTVQIVTSGPAPLLPDQLTDIFIMSRPWAEQHDVIEPQNFKAKEENYATLHANGTGPFKLKVREPGVRTVLERNASWWGLGRDPHNVDEIEYRPIPDPAARVAALLNGELDFLLDPPLADIERVKTTHGLKVQQTNQLRAIFFGLDVGSDELESSNLRARNPFKDPRVREAMYRAIDIDAIHEQVMKGFSLPAGIIIAPGAHGYTKELDTRLPYDPGRAKELMADAGYAHGFSVKLDCPNNRYNNDEAICRAVVPMLAKIGIQATLDAQPKAVHFPKITNKQSDFYMFGWGALDSYEVFPSLVRSQGEFNGTHYSNPEVDRLIDAIGTEIDLAKRDAMIADVWQIVKRENIYLPLHHQVIAWAIKENLELPMEPNDTPQFRWARFK